MNRHFDPCVGTAVDPEHDQVKCSFDSPTWAGPHFVHLFEFGLPAEWGLSVVRNQECSILHRGDSHFLMTES